MGIPHLLSYCLNTENGCLENVNLVKISQQRSGIELLVDFENFLHSIRHQFVESLCISSGNEYNKLYEGEYATFHHFVCNLLNKLKSVSITLRFYIDGSKGSCREQIVQKLETWKKREIHNFGKVNIMLNVCCGAENVQCLRYEDCVQPVCIRIQFIHSIQLCGLEIVQIPSGEADHVIAKDLEQREKAFAVLSNDSDFCIFRNCRFIPHSIFDEEKDLLLEEIHEPFSTTPPKKIICRMVTNERMVASLGFSSEFDLIEMSILMGNDFTMPFLNGGLHSKIGCRQIEEYADIIRHYRKVEFIPQFIHELQHSPAFQAAIEYSRAFYLLRISEQPIAGNCFFTKMIEENIKDLKYAPHILGMHLNFYWRKIVLEDTTPGAPCAEIAVETLRAVIYHMILPAHIKTVKEYGRTPYQKLDCYQVRTIDDSYIPKINHIQPNQIWKNLRHFHYIMTHLEKGNVESLWTDKYGRKNGFKCLLLRYFLLLNWRKNLYVTEDEFLGLVAMVFGGHNKENEYQTVPICPSPRCVTLGSWIEVIYRTMFLFLSKLLFLSSEFPLPHELFSGSVWNVFFVCSKQLEWQKDLRRHRKFLHEATNYMKSIIRDKRHIIKHLTEGCFHFDDMY